MISCLLCAATRDPIPAGASYFSNRRSSRPRRTCSHSQLGKITKREASLVRVAKRQSSRKRSILVFARGSSTADLEAFLIPLEKRFSKSLHVLLTDGQRRGQRPFFLSPFLSVSLSLERFSARRSIDRDANSFAARTRAAA